MTLLQRWSPFKSRFSEKSSYMVNGMSFSRPGTRSEAFSASYSKSAYSKTGFSASVQHVMGAHDIKAGFDYNQHTMRSYSAIQQ